MRNEYSKLCTSTPVVSSGMNSLLSCRHCFKCFLNIVGDVSNVWCLLVTATIHVELFHCFATFSADHSVWDPPTATWKYQAVAVVRGL